MRKNWLGQSSYAFECYRPFFNDAVKQRQASPGSRSDWKNTEYPNFFWRLQQVRRTDAYTWEASGFIKLVHVFSAE